MRQGKRWYNKWKVNLYSSDPVPVLFMLRCLYFMESYLTQKVPDYYIFLLKATKRSIILNFGILEITLCIIWDFSSSSERQVT